MIPKLKVFCLKILESDQFERLSMFIIGIYTVFLMFWLISPEFSPGPEGLVSDKIMTGIDTYFLVIFFTEIVMKLFASNFMYIYDGFNMFDSIIVIISLIFNVIGVIIKFLGVLRLIRVVVIILRNITGNTIKLRH